MHPGNTRLRITGDDLIEVSPELGSKLGAVEKPRNPTFRELDGAIFSGRFEVHNPRQGLHLYVLDLRVNRDVELHVATTQAASIMTLVLSGACRQRIPRINRRESVIDFNSGQNVICTFQTGKSRFDLAGGKVHRIVDLHIDPEKAEDLITLNKTSVGDPLNSLFSQTDKSRSATGISLPQHLEDIAHQILGCPYQGGVRQLFMESKALEILALELDIFSRTKSPESGISKQDAERLELARHILQKEYLDPPSLAGLARRVGLNDFKLKRGFRQVYNTTVFGYVRRLRLEKARALLETGEYNVTEAGTVAGYSCLGHFSTAFKKHFGLLPSAILLKQPSCGRRRC